MVENTCSQSQNYYIAIIMKQILNWLCFFADLHLLAFPRIGRATSSTTSPAGGAQLANASPSPGSAIPFRNVLIRTNRTKLSAVTFLMVISSICTQSRVQSQSQTIKSISNISILKNNTCNHIRHK